MILITIVGAVLLMGGLVAFLAGGWILKYNHLILHQQKQAEPRIAVLIPARDEGKVIEGLLRSIERQSYKILSEDVYVILE